MKTALLSVLSVLLAGTAVMAQPKPTLAADEAALRAIEEKWDAANVKGDAAALESIYADSFISTNTDGKVRTKAETLARMKSGEVKYTSAKIQEMKVNVFGDAAVVLGLWKGKFTEKGKPVESTERFTDTFIRQNGQWRCVASQSTTVK